MKTSLVTAFLAVALVAVAGCSSDNSSTLVTNAAGTVQQGGACSSTADCESPLSCAYPVVPDAGSSCKAAGVCIAMGSVSVIQACSCAATPTVITVNYNENYVTPQPIQTGITCGGGEGGAVSTPTGDASTGGATTGG